MDKWNEDEWMEQWNEWNQNLETMKHDGIFNKWNGMREMENGMIEWTDNDRESLDMTKDTYLADYDAARRT